MTDVQRFTAQDLESLERARVEWAAQAFSTAPADRPRAEAAMEAMYAWVGMATPKFEWVRDPGELPRFRRLMSRSDPPVASLLHGRLRQVLGSSVYAQVVVELWADKNRRHGLIEPSAATWWRNLRRLIETLRPWLRGSVGLVGLPAYLLPDLDGRLDIEVLEFFARCRGNAYAKLVSPFLELARAGHLVLPRAHEGPAPSGPPRMLV